MKWIMTTDERVVINCDHIRHIERKGRETIVHTDIATHTWGQSDEEYEILLDFLIDLENKEL